MKKVHSLRYRLTFLILALLATIGATFVWMADREVRQALRLSGMQRAAVAAQQVADLLAQSAASRAAETRRIAADADVHRALQSGRVPVEPDIPVSIRDFLARNEHATVWLYDAHGTLIAVNEASPI